MRRWSPFALVCLVALSALGMAAPVLADSAFGVSAKLTFLGNLGPGGAQRYRYDYTLTNNTVTPELGAFQVFFNSDPVTQLPTGDKATLVSYASPLGWESVTEMPKNADGQWSLNWDWDYASGLDVVPGTSLAGFVVVFDWNDPGSLPSVQLTQARNGSAHDGVTEVTLSLISGVVTGKCGCTTKALQGITVDLFSIDAAGEEMLVACTATDVNGNYTFANVGLGNYEVTMITPLDYAADTNSHFVTVNETGLGFAADFALRCETICRHPRTVCYWQHQVNTHMCGNRGGHPDESRTEMLGYIDLILTHFNENITNPVLIYVPDSDDPSSELLKLRQLLMLNRCSSADDLAKRELLSLLLNVVSGKISQNTVICSNGTNVSQAITYCNDLILLPDKCSAQKAALIASIINNGMNVPYNMVPASTRMITYSMKPVVEEPVEFRLDAAAPNPSRGTAVAIRFGLARADQVDLRVFDVSGRMLKTLASGSFAAGPYRMTWDGTDDSGARVQPGIYFYRLVTEEGTLSRSVTLQR
jgi:hypothetical protein